MTKTAAIKVAGYIRVSTVRQEKEGFSLPAQEERIKSYVESEGGRKLVKIYQEVMSGTKADRPQLNNLMRDAEAGRFQEVVVIAIDRFGRGTVDLLKNIDNLHRLKVNFVSLREKIDLSTATGKFLRTVMAAMAELENEIRRERVASVKAERLKEGKLVGGQLPFGYERDKNGEFVRNEKQIETYLEMVRLCLAGNSNDKIAQFLNDRGYPTKRGKGKWHNSVVGKVLNNRAYFEGYFMINKWGWDEEKGDWVEKPKTEQIKSPLPGEPVITKETFAAIRRSIESRIANKGRSSKKWLLAGLLKCTCGAFFVGLKNQWGRYYRCNNRCTSPGRRTTKQKCMMPLLDAQRVEEIIWNRVKQYITKPGLIVEELSGEAERNRTKERLTEEVDKLKFEFEKVKRSQLQLVRKFTDGEMEEDIYNPRYKELRARRERIETELLLKEQELKLLQTEIENMEGFEEGRDILTKFSQQLAVKLDKLKSEDVKRKLIRSFYSRAEGGYIQVELGDEGFEHVRQFKPTGRSKELVFLVPFGAFVPMRVVQVLREEGLLVSLSHQIPNASTISLT